MSSARSRRGRSETPPLEPEATCADGDPAGLKTGANTHFPEENARLVFITSAELAHLFRAALATVQRRIERIRGRPCCQSEALEAMLEHAVGTWGDRDPRELPPDYRVFERDGWRCTAPGCSSYRNLHRHHVVFRSHCGSNALSNLTTLCAWHHQRGVHDRVIRCTGQAPDALRFELGVRPDHPSLLVYGSGDVRMA